MLVQAAAGATTMAGTALGTDIESGFLSRLALTPMRGGGRSSRHSSPASPCSGVDAGGVLSCWWG